MPRSLQRVSPQVGRLWSMPLGRGAGKGVDIVEEGVEGREGTLDYEGEGVKWKERGEDRDEWEEATP